MSFQEGSIVGYLGKKKVNDVETNINQFILELPEDKEWDQNPGVDQISIAHDYVRFTGNCSFQMESDVNGKYPYKAKTGASNWIPSRASVTIGIRDMFDIVLPMLNNHKFLQPEHVCDRTQDSDDTHFETLGLSKPRYKKGDKYPSYAFSAGIVQFYDHETSRQMVSFRRVGEKHWETITKSLFDQIKDNLKLCYSSHELNKSV